MQEKAFPFEVDESSDAPLWVQLRQRIVYLMNAGYFHPGDQLPTVRGLASDISINYNTVNKAYRSLVADGYLESARGRGVFVRGLDSDVAADDGQRQEMVDALDGCIDSCRALGMLLDDIRRCMVGRIQDLKKQEAAQSATDKGTDPLAVPAPDLAPNIPAPSARPSEAASPAARLSR